MTKTIKIFFLFLFLGMVISVIAQNNHIWDFANYHYYNAYSFLNGRLDIDVVPASVQTFFNPIMDIPLYFMIKYFNNTPNVIWALQGIWFGLFLFIFYKISQLFFNQKNKNIWIAFSLLIASTGQATFFQVGSCTNEIPIAFLDLWGIYILLKMVQNPDQQTLKKFFYSGLLFGTAMGLKLTSVHCCIATGLTLIFCKKYLRQYIKSVRVFALAGLLGFLIIHGYFMYKYWIMYENPAFPFLNGIFHSPYYENINFSDQRAVPPLTTLLFYPFAFNFTQTVYETGVLFDFRLTFCYIFLLCTILYLLLKEKISIVLQNNKLSSFLFIFLLIDYLLWLKIFSIHRYAILIEILTFFLVLDFLQKLDIKRKIPRILMKSLCVICFIIVVVNPVYWVLGNQKNPEWRMIDFGNKFVDVEEIHLPQNSLIKQYAFPSSFVIPFFDNGNFQVLSYHQKIEGINFHLSDYGEFKKKKDSIEKNHKGIKVYLYVDTSLYMVNSRRFLPLKEQKHIYDTFKKFVEKTNNDFFKQKFEEEEKKYHLWNEMRDEMYSQMKDDYYCRPLKNNIVQNLVICVPNELKDEIFGQKSN